MIPLLERFHRLNELTVVGVMSGTSADGTDVAIASIGAERCELVGFHYSPYPKELRQAVLDAAEGELPAREVFELGTELAVAYAEAIRLAIGEADVTPDLVGLHGQTIYHAPRRQPHGLSIQLGDAALVAELLGLPVISDFRSADVAAGGEGAPLVPWCDLRLFADAERNRVCLNIGGIANLTWLPAGCAAEDVIAFDTGPGNALIDAAVQELFERDYDDDGALAGAGTPIEQLLESLLEDAYFDRTPPKSCGREQFGARVGRTIARQWRVNGHTAEDVVSTLTELTVRSICRSLQTHLPMVPDEIVVGGGGTKNSTIMRRLRNELPGIDVSTTEKYGIPSEAKEALAFALLAEATVRGVPAALPSVTGANHATICGAIRVPGNGRGS